MLAPLTCAVVMLLSGVAKAGRPTATRDAFRSMGVPQALRSETLATSLPYVEIVLGVLLLATWSWPLAVVGAATTALFAAYWVLVLRVLRRDEEVDCGCFGALGDDRVSGTTLARNSLLVVLGILATAFGASGSGVVPAVADFDTADWWWLLLSVVVAATAVLVVGLRRPGETVAEEDLLDYERDPIPFALLENESGTRVTLRQLAAERPQLLLFLSTYCWACESVAEKAPAWVSQLGPVEISIVFTEPLERVPANMRPDGVPTWSDVEEGATQTFASGRPSAVLLGADGALAGGPVTGADAVATFVEEIVTELTSARDLPMPVEPERASIGAHDHSHEPTGDEGHDHA